MPKRSGIKKSRVYRDPYVSVVFGAPNNLQDCCQRSSLNLTAITRFRRRSEVLSIVTNITVSYALHSGSNYKTCPHVVILVPS